MAYLQKSDMNRKSNNRYYMYRPKPKIYKQTWEFHKGDSDPYPSVPHGHSLCDNKLKLRIWDGAVIKDKQIVGYPDFNSITKENSLIDVFLTGN